MFNEDSNFKGSPEDYMVIPKGNGLDIDTLCCALKRAEGLSILLSTSLDESGSRMSDEVLSNVSWALEGTIKQALIVAEGSLD